MNLKRKKLFYNKDQYKLIYKKIKSKKTITNHKEIFNNRRKSQMIYKEELKHQFRINFNLNRNFKIFIMNMVDYLKTINH